LTTIMRGCREPSQARAAMCQADFQRLRFDSKSRIRTSLNKRRIETCFDENLVILIHITLVRRHFAKGPRREDFADSDGPASTSSIVKEHPTSPPSAAPCRGWGRTKYGIRSPIAVKRSEKFFLRTLSDSYQSLACTSKP